MSRRVSSIAGRYRLVEAIGSGGQGDVWVVEDGQQGGARRVLKAVRGRAGESELAHEFERLTRLEHPALPRVRDLGVLAAELGPMPAGTLYFTADEIEGVPVDEAMAAAPAAERGRMLWSAAIDVASALAHVHAAGLCHCDVTPRNVLVTGSGERTRAVLIDLGLSAVRGVIGEARGTLAYMAPEALAGVIDPRADLWGLGATLFHAAAGAPPFGGADRGAMVRAILTQAPPRLEAAQAPGLVDLVARLLQRAPSARPPSALAVFDELVEAAAALAKAPKARPRPTVRPPLVAPTTLGADAALAELGRALAACRGGERVAPMVVCGPVGAGAADVVTHAVRRHQLEAAARGEVPVVVVSGRLDAVALALELDVEGASAERPGALAAAVVARASARAATATVVDVGGDERASGLFAALAAAGGPGLLLVVADGATPPPRLRSVVLGPVSAAVLGALAAEMLGRTPPPGWVDGLTRAARGLPAVAAAVVTALAGADDPFALDPERDAEGATLDELRWRHVVARGAAARTAAEVLAAWDGSAAVELIAATVIDGAPPTLEPRRGDRGDGGRGDGGDEPWGAWAGRGIAELCDLGAARRERGVVTMAPGLVVAVTAATPMDRMSGWHVAAVALARRRGLPATAWAFHLAALHADADAVAPLCAAAEELLRRGRPARAQVLAEAAARIAGPAGAAAALIGARAALVAGAYPAAVALATRAVAELDDPAARLVLARAHQRAGDGAAAEELLAALAAARPDDADVIGAYARLLVARGRYPGALAAVDALGRLPRSAGGALCAEAAGSALLYRGDTAAADARFVEAEAIAVAIGDRALIGRARALRGMAAQHRGDLAAASSWYRDAAVDARAGGDLHAAAIAELNHGTTLAERGRHGEALPVLAAATAALGALGHVVELAAAELDRGLSLLAVGQVDAAAEAARAAATADPERTPQLAVFARLLAGDIARRRGNDPAAVAAYEDARALAARHRLPDERHAVRAIAVIDAWRDPAAAARAVDALDGADTSTDERDRTLLVRGRLALAHPGADLAPLGDRLAALATRARTEDRRDRAWRAGWLSAALADAAGNADVARTRARAALSERLALQADTPPAFRAGLADDPDAIALAHMVAPVDVRPARTATRRPDPRRAPAPPSPPVSDSVSASASASASASGSGSDSASVSASDSASVSDSVSVSDSERTGPTPELETLRLRRLLALSRRLHAEPSLERLLDEVIDTAIELTRAERGFLLLERAGALEVVVARGFAAGALTDPAAVSRSIAQRAVDGGEPVVTVDAGVDERFGGAASVAAHRLRSVVAVPLHQRGQVGGCLYVDHRLRPSAFDDDATGLVVELADIAALAIDNARHADELRRQKAELDVLAGRLGAEVAEREAELAAVRSRLAVTRDRLGPGLDAIIGSSPEVLAMLDVVQRAARVVAPVVIVGESGTGKELVARALHDAGPRHDRPFVAVNCGAMPEHLLESELFGHVRGAFTGADRDRRGLFEVADGGTLFLDEIADTGPAMQAKLLRVLQDGVLRRVGDDRTRQVDVRVVAATQRSLAELAAAGAFRDDLRFRLEVITIRVPPLRDRAVDLPLLVEHLLARLAPGKPPALTRAAWRALAAHGWPGNVRELENALARAVALGGDVIDEPDLPEAVAARPAAVPAASGPTPGEDLRLRPALETIERAYIAAALERAKGNQTVAARLLGLSRFGLQKKLRRAADERDAVDE